MTFNNTGHGHVTPRSDGCKARCGGPALCVVCQREAAQQLGECQGGYQTLEREVADLRQQLAYHEAQDGLLSKAQDEADRLRAELAEVKRPLDEQMARLNANITAANERITTLALDAERLDWLQFHGARVAWGNDDEVCNVVWADRDGSYYTALFTDWREAIDAAMANKFKERP